VLQNFTGITETFLPVDAPTITKKSRNGRDSESNLRKQNILFRDSFRNLSTPLGSVCALFFARRFEHVPGGVRHIDEVVELACAAQPECAVDNHAFAIHVIGLAT
jgi:hypothetical protein